MAIEERREHTRQSLAMPARLRKLTHDLPATIRDLSPAGCKLESAGMVLEPGNRVLIRPNGCESLLGSVIWSSDGHAGIKFDAEVPQSQVDQFCRLFPNEGTTVRLDVAA